MWPIPRMRHNSMNEHTPNHEKGQRFADSGAEGAKDMRECLRGSLPMMKSLKSKSSHHHRRCWSLHYQQFAHKQRRPWQHFHSYLWGSQDNLSSTRRHPSVQSRREPRSSTSTCCPEGHQEHSWHKSVRKLHWTGRYWRLD